MMDKNTLKILNSFTRRKDSFVPNDRKTIKWYSCGPTVYDVAHLGHARCYITFDIIRRILSGYFGYQVFYVMNITDIDDKIIKRARSNYLCDKFIENSTLNFTQQSPTQELVDQLRQFIDNYETRRREEQDAAKLDMINNIISSSRKILDELREKSSSKKLKQEELRPILEQLRDVIADEQDLQFAHTVSDHEIFKSLTRKYEQEYHEDMQRLDVLPPSALTRVSEFIDETGAFIKKLELNGFAYRSGGSIYFDTDKFDSDPRHSYAKLVREAFGQKKDLEEGEGELSLAHLDKKRSPNDFALWKKSKIGEPSWQTQDFEAGRPGWHIECSVMASHLLGENFDIHSGGCDLKFPHHDNEIAQAEAYYNTGKNWVNYFIHSGHLTISGCKMSKSLKNFITIRQALQEYTSRQLRFAFLAHGWTETLDYSPNTMNTALTYEKTFKEFLLNIADEFRRRLSQSSTDNSDGSTVRPLNDHFNKWSPSDQELNQEFLETVNKVDAALNDNFDTRTALQALCGIVKECNKRTNVSIGLLRDVVSYVRRILGIFGANFEDIHLDQYLANGRMSSSSSKTSEDSATIMKFVDMLAQFRSEVRRISKGGDAQLSVNQILGLCDELRDRTLPSVGVRLEDKEMEGATYVVKLLDAETLARERAQAARKEEERRLREETQRLERLRLQQERADRAKMMPSEMFKQQTDKYSRFDERGLPTHDANNQELSKSAAKKLQRLYAEQEARYAKYKAEQQN